MTKCIHYVLSWVHSSGIDTILLELRFYKTYWEGWECFYKSVIIEDRFIYETSSVALQFKNEHSLGGKIKHCNYWICVHETIQFSRIDISVKRIFIISVSLQWMPLQVAFVRKVFALLIIPLAMFLVCIHSAETCD